MTSPNKGGPQGASLPDAILATVAKSHAQAPFRVDALPGLVGADLEACAAAVESMFQARTLSYADITKDGASYRVIWPTGVPPQPVGSRAYVINAHTQADAAAKALHPRKSQANQPAGMPAPQEATMPRITAPAVARSIPAPQTEKPIRGRHAISTKGSGLLQNALLSALMDATPDDPLSANHLIHLCPMAGSVGSISTTLQTLVKRGLVHSLSLVSGGRRQNHYYLAAPDDHVAAAGKTITGAALNDGHEQNLALVRKLTSDEAAVIPVAVGKVIPDPATPALDSSRLPAKDAGKDAGATLNRHPDLDRASFAFYDDSSLEIFKGDETVILPALEVARLVAFLGRIAA